MHSCHTPVAEALHHLLDKQVPWVWENPQQIAFNHVKQLLGSNRVRTHFDEKPIILAFDASPYGIVAVLSHKMPDGREELIAFYSSTLSSAERNYTKSDKEALAVFVRVKKFYDCVFGCQFQIYHRR